MNPPRIITLEGTVLPITFGLIAEPAPRRTTWSYDPDDDQLVAHEHPIGNREVLRFWFSVPTTNGSRPRSFRCTAAPELLDALKPGDRVRLTGQASLLTDDYSSGAAARCLAVLGVQQLDAHALAAA